VEYFEPIQIAYQATFIISNNFKLFIVKMSGKAVAVGIAVLLAYFLHYILSLGSFSEKLSVKYDDLYERWKKLYLFGIFGLLSIHMPSTYAAVFAWISLVVLGFYYCSAMSSDEERKKRLFNVTGLAYISVLTVWWIGETANIFSNV
jgi:hypothetical protein